MAEWTAKEKAWLADRWVGRSSRQLTLPVACPYCTHNDAFADVVVPKDVVGDATAYGGGGGIGVEAIEAEPPIEVWPDEWVVACKCGHAEHGDDIGCGKDGPVPI